MADHVGIGTLGKLKTDRESLSNTFVRQVVTHLRQRLRDLFVPSRPACVTVHGWSRSTSPRMRIPLPRPSPQ